MVKKMESIFILRHMSIDSIHETFERELGAFMDKQLTCI